MLSRLLGLKDGDTVNYFQWSLRQPWPVWVAIVLLAAALGFVVYLYYSERGITRARRGLLGALRLALLWALILMLFEPVFAVDVTRKVRSNVLVLADRSQSMDIRDRRERPEDKIAAALALGKVKPEDAGTAILTPYLKDIESATRFDLTKGLLGGASGIKAFSQIGERHVVRYFSFGRSLEAAGEGDTAAKGMLKLQPTDEGTALGSAIQEALDTHQGQPVGAVILLTDGGSNEGLNVLDVAARLRDRKIPVYPVGVGLPAPPDVRIVGVLAPDTVFDQDEVTVRVQLRSDGYDNSAAEIRLMVDGVDAGGTDARKRVVLNGGEQVVEFKYTPRKKNTQAEGKEQQELKVVIANLPGETDEGNNTATKPVTVTDEKIKVLYVEGKPRWEYRYLRGVLLRDRRLDVKFLMTQGDAELATYQPKQYISRFPDEPTAANQFDLVIMGDVPASYFRGAQMERIDQLVRKHSGSLLMLAGHRYAPATYARTPIADLLPVRVEGSGTYPVDADTFPTVTAKGLDGALGQLDVTEKLSQDLWQVVRPIYMVPAVSAKESATLLLSFNKPVGPTRDPYPLLAWHQVGSGKVMYVGTDQLWRLRYRTGDKYHARFWSQSIQFLTLSRLLGGNKRFYVDVDHKDREYATGERMMITVNALNVAWEPEGARQLTVFIDRDADANGPAVETPVRLDPLADAPGMYQGAFNPPKPGRYTLRSTRQDVEAGISNKVAVNVQTKSLERADLGAQVAMLNAIAATTGGKYLSIQNLSQLPGLIKEPQSETHVRLERDLWDLPLIFVILVLFAGTEWYVRRRSNLM